MSDTAPAKKPRKKRTKTRIVLSLVAAVVGGVFLVSTLESASEARYKSECHAELPFFLTHVQRPAEGASMHGRGGPNDLTVCDVDFPDHQTGQYTVRKFSDGTLHAVVVPFTQRIP